MAVTLENKSHAEDLQRIVYQLFLDHHLCDSVLSTPDGSTFLAHGFVLAGQSYVLKNALERNQYRLQIQDVKPEDLSTLLEYLYTGKLAVSAQNASSIRDAAQRLGISSAVQLLHKHPDILGVSRKLENEDTKNIKQESLPITGTDQNGATIKRGHETLLPAVKKEKTSYPRVIMATPPEKIDNGKKSTPRRSERKSVKAKRFLENIRERKEDLENSKQKPPCKKSKNTTSDNEIISDVEDNDHEIASLETDSSHNDDCGRGQTRCRKERSQIAVSSNDGLSSEKPPEARNIDGGMASQMCTGLNKDNHSIEKETREDPPTSLEGNPDMNDSNMSGNINGNESTQNTNIKSNSRQLKCDECKRRFICLAILKCHQKRLHTKRQFVFTNVSDSLRHNIVLASDNVGGKLRCKVCNCKFSLKTQFHKHFFRNHFKKYKCKRCPLLFTRRRFLNLHRCRKHDKIKNTTKIKSCDFCSRMFLHSNNLRRHLHSCHNHSEKQNVFSKTISECQHCKKVMTTKSLHRHLKSHCKTLLKKTSHSDNESMKAKCELCNKAFGQSSTLKRHFQFIHQLKEDDFQEPDGSIVYRCTELGCKKPFKILADLKSHMISVHPNVFYACVFCRGYKTRVNLQLHNHIRKSHEGKQTMCELCGKLFTKPFCLRLHKYTKHNIHHPKLKIFRCDFEGCDYTSVQCSNMKLHARSHQQNKLFTCPICDKKLKTEKNLEKHMNKVHLGKRPFICEICGQSYGEEHELKVHIKRQHDQLKRFQCDLCKYTTPDKFSYQGHMFAIHRQKVSEKQKIFKCEQCDYMSDKKRKFLDHVNSHQNIRDYTCTKCGKSFITPATLRTHVQWVHVKKPFHCDFCEHVTMSASHLKEHVRTQHTHRDIKPYKCLYCDFRCAISGNCRKHVMNKHKGQKVGWVKVCEKYPESNPSERTNENTKEVIDNENNEMLNDITQIIAVSQDEIVIDNQTEQTVALTYTNQVPAYNHDSKPDASHSQFLYTQEIQGAVSYLIQ